MDRKFPVSKVAGDLGVSPNGAMCQLITFFLNTHCTAGTKLAPQQDRQGYTSGPFDPLFSGGPALTVFCLLLLAVYASQWSIARIFQAFVC
jgi:hypothetical protein